MQIKSILAALMALILAACNPMEQVDTADSRVTSFHASYNEGDARALYGQTADEFREVTSIDQMNDLVALVTEKMGTVEETERTGISINAENGETVTTVTMRTTFDKGEGTETFIFYGTADDMRLVGWNVDSPNFLEVPEDVVTEVEPAE